MEDQLRALENQKQSHDMAAAKSPTRASSPREPSMSYQQEHYSTIITSTKSDDSDTTLTYPWKRHY